MIENPSMSEVIGFCGGDEKMNDHAEPNRSRTLKKHQKHLIQTNKRKKSYNALMATLVVCKFYVTFSICVVYAL